MPNGYNETKIKVNFVAHRLGGASSVQSDRDDNSDMSPVPENTIAALWEAANKGVVAFECDLYKTADDQLVVIHDDDLSVNATYIVQREQEVPTSDGQYLKPNDRVLIKPCFQDPNTQKTSGTLVTQHRANDLLKYDVSYAIRRVKREAVAMHLMPPNIAEKNRSLYTLIPKYTSLLLNVRILKAQNQQKHFKLNIELKGSGTGKLVQSMLDITNGDKDYLHLPKISNEDITYLSFNKEELKAIVKSNPKAKIILGVPTAIQYRQVDDRDNYTIVDSNLNEKDLEDFVIKAHEEIKALPNREGKGLDGVDMSLWDVSDKSIEYFSKKLQVPIHVAIVPYSHKQLESDVLIPALSNLPKLIKAQEQHLPPGEYEINIKTDDPLVVKKKYEELMQHYETELHKINSITILDTSRKRSNVPQIHNKKKPIELYPKPYTKNWHTWQEKIKSERGNQPQEKKQRT